MRNENLNPEEKALQKLQRIKNTKAGTYSFIVSVVLLAVIVIVNLLAGLVPSKFMRFDTSANQIYSISDNTKKFLGKLKEDVTINWICSGGSTDDMVETFVSNYVASSSHLSLRIIDPVSNPKALDNYLQNADETPTNYSFIVESGKRWKIVDYSELFYFYNQLLEEQLGLGKVPYEVYAYYQYYFALAEQQYGYPTEELFYGDDTITKAIEYVTLDNIPHIYIVEGHGEDTFSASFSSMLAQNNVQYETLRLYENQSIPDDAGCIIINSPNNDISSDDAAMLKEYIGKGGNILLITSYEDTGKSNLMSVMSEYGMYANPGMLYEDDASYYRTNNTILRPSVNSSHEVTSAPASNGYVMLMPNAHGIKIQSDTPAMTLPLLSTSNSAYTKDGDSKSLGSLYYLGVASTLETSAGESKAVWFSSSEAFTDSAAQASSYGNYYYLFYSIYWLNETYETSLATVEGPSLAEPLLNGLTESSVRIWTVIFDIVIPGVILICGIAVWVKRKKR